MKMSKMSETYAILCIDGDACKIVGGGYSGAKEVKDATIKIAKEDGNIGKVFVPIRMWAPISFKEIKRYEFVEPEIDIPVLADSEAATDISSDADDDRQDSEPQKPEVQKVAEEPKVEKVPDEPAVSEKDKVNEATVVKEDVKKSQEAETKKEETAKAPEQEPKKEEVAAPKAEETKPEEKAVAGGQVTEVAEEGQVEQGKEEDSTAFDELFGTKGSEKTKAADSELF